MEQLGLVPVEELLEAGNAVQVTVFFQGECVAGEGGLAVVEHQLEDHGHVDAQHLGLGILLTGGAHLHTADEAVIFRVLLGNAHPQLGRDAGPVIEEGGEADAGLDEGHALGPHGVGHVIVVAQGDKGLVEPQAAGGLEDDVGHGVGGELAVGAHTADGDVLIGVEVGAELDPEGVDVVAGLLVGQAALLHVLLVEGIEGLVQTAQGDGGGLVFRVEHLVGQPDELYRLEEGLGHALGDLAAAFSDLGQLGLVGGVRLGGGHFSGLGRIAADVGHGGPVAPQHGLHIGPVGLVYLSQGGFAFFHEGAVALGNHDVVAGQDMAALPVLEEPVLHRQGKGLHLIVAGVPLFQAVERFAFLGLTDGLHAEVRTVTGVVVLRHIHRQGSVVGIAVGKACQQVVVIQVDLLLCQEAGEAVREADSRRGVRVLGELLPVDAVPLGDLAAVMVLDAVVANLADTG